MDDASGTSAFARRTGLEEWFRTPLGRALLGTEHAIFADKLPYLFGYHLLRLSAVDDADATTSSMIGHRFALAPTGGGEVTPGALAELDALPLENDSMDIVLLQHVLEFSERPHAILREANRVLVPNGRLLIAGINPLSLVGLRALVAGWRNPAVWRSQHLGVARLMDWLSLLELRVVDVRFGFYRLPFNSARWLERRRGKRDQARRLSLPIGGIYVVDACKTVASLTPLRPQWKLARGGISLGIARPQVPTSRYLH